MCEIDLDQCEVFEDTPIKAARKDHVCSCCGGRISRGDSYVAHFSITDRQPCNEKACTACVMVFEDFETKHGTRSSPGYMRELIRACIDYERTGPDAEYWRGVLDAMRARAAGAAA